MAVAENNFSLFTDGLAVGVFPLSFLTYSSALVLYTQFGRTYFKTKLPQPVSRRVRDAILSDLRAFLLIYWNRKRSWGKWKSLDFDPWLNDWPHAVLHGSRRTFSVSCCGP